MIPAPKLLPFEARARTLDHLGREQIADSPTAVSELWKNAYDAYATSVALHVFSGPPALVAIVDNGHGMSADEFIERWLVIGTDVKLTRTETAQDRLGLPKRERQGQKGIGRLSVAFLGPVAVVLSKRRSHPYVASAIDWRVFENPHLLLSDIVTPVAEFDDIVELPVVMSALVEALTENVWPRATTPRADRINDAWKRYSDYEHARGVTTSTLDRIASSAMNLDVSHDVLNVWPASRGSDTHGTALMVFEPKPELLVLAVPSAASSSDEAQELRKNLLYTLVGFVDPYTTEPSFFDYSVIAHRTTGAETVLTTDEQFGRDQFLTLEHIVEGRFDAGGNFTGEVRAFGQSFGNLRIPASVKYPHGKSPVGPFEFSIGTFEQDPGRTTHTPEEHHLLAKRADMFAGLRIYRDRLRVMPYGRPDQDFFGMEQRRAQHAGREFWQHHRVFGRVALTKYLNPNLRDKAGREGLIDNQARRELRHLIVHLLHYTSRKYFGTDSSIRTELMAEIQAEQKSARAARSAARKSLTQSLLRTLKANGRAIDAAIVQAQELAPRIDAAGITELATIDGEVHSLLETVRQLKPPQRAGKLGANESKYLEYRERYRRLTAAADDARASLRSRIVELQNEDKGATLERHLTRLRTELIKSLNSLAKNVANRLNEERQHADERVARDREKVHAFSATLQRPATKQPVDLDAIEDAFDELGRELFPFYERYIELLDKLGEGIDVGLVLASSLYEGAELQDRLVQLNALAQMGITVEIVGHELERLDDEARNQLSRLPDSIKSTNAFRQAFTAYETLVNRLKFLAPLQVSGPRVKERIEGAQIATYIGDFYGSRFATEGVSFRSTPAFDDIVVLDYTYRLLPVFVNLVNNSLYWLQFTASRQIVLDARDDFVVVADNGPGVDPDDVESLFELFFTRRSSGRGIGLYLAKANLGASGHTISYSNGGPVLGGANFVITLKGMVRASSERQSSARSNRDVH